MNDITKARYFLKHRGSALQHLQSFSLMLSSAEQKYREVKMRQTGNKDVPGTWEQVEAEAFIDLAVLKYMKKHNQLPSDITSLFAPGVSPEQKQVLAKKWAGK